MLVTAESRHLLQSCHKLLIERVQLLQPRFCRRQCVAFCTLAPPIKFNPAAKQILPTTKAQLRVQQLSHQLSTQSQNNDKMSSYTVRKHGAPNTPEYRMYLERDGVPVSPFHDIPLYANDQQTVLNMVVEIPRWTNAKMEVRL